MAIAVAEKRRDSLGSAKVREALVGYAFVILPLAFFFLFFIFPMVYAIYISRYDWGVLGPIESVGFQNYRELYRTISFEEACRTSSSTRRSSCPARWRSGCSPRSS